MARIAITGASGLLGSNLAAQLLAAGHQVVATRRPSTQVAHLEDLKIEWRDAALGDPTALRTAFSGAEAVFHCAAVVSVRKEITPEMQATNVEGTRHVIAAAIDAGVRRLIHTSSVVTIGLSLDGSPCDESTRWNAEEPLFKNAYAITKRQAEIDVLASADRLDTVIINPGYLFGPRDARPSSGKVLVDIVKRKLPGWTPGINNFVDARDVARGAIAAWQRGRSGERYILGGHNLTYRAMIEMAARLGNVAPPRLSLPFAVARVVGWWGDVLERRGGHPVVNSTQIQYAYSDRFLFTSAKAERELGYVRSPLEPAIRDALAWFREHKMLECARTQ
jgi:dihydroflavonol-4-reductase